MNCRNPHRVAARLFTLFILFAGMQPCVADPEDRHGALYCENLSTETVRVVARHYQTLAREFKQLHISWTVGPGQEGFLTRKDELVYPYSVSYKLVTESGETGWRSKQGIPRKPFVIQVTDSDLDRIALGTQSDKPARVGAMFVTNQTSRRVLVRCVSYLDRRGEEHSADGTWSFSAGQKGVLFDHGVRLVAAEAEFEVAIEVENTRESPDWRTAQGKFDLDGYLHLRIENRLFEVKGKESGGSARKISGTETD